MIYLNVSSFYGRCLLALVILVTSTLLISAQETKEDNLSVEEKAAAILVNPDEEQDKTQKNTTIPIGLFAYNKWVDLNENDLVEENEFFGLGRQSFAKGEPISASLHLPDMEDGTNLKLRIWDTSGNLIRTVRKKYKSNPIFTYSGFDSFLPVGVYILTVNPEGTEKTYQIQFMLKEPNGNSMSKLRKKLLPEDFYLFEEWLDEDGDMRLDSTEVFGLNKSLFEPGKVKLQIGLNVPRSDNMVVYQVWNEKQELLAMKISRLDSLQFFTMQKDTMNRGNDFLRVLKDAPEGNYSITASVDGEETRKFELALTIGDSTTSILTAPPTETNVAAGASVAAGTGVVAETVSAGEEVATTAVETVADEVKTPDIPMNVKENVENLAPEFNKGQEGFFFFTGFIDFNENNKQERSEFMGADQEHYYSESENVFVQFHLPMFANREVVLQTKNSNDELVRQQTGYYGESPFVFKVSTPDEPLPAGEYKMVMIPEGSEIKYRLELVIK
jgi:hypothetical protein